MLLLLRSIYSKYKHIVIDIKIKIKIEIEIESESESEMMYKLVSSTCDKKGKT